MAACSNLAECSGETLRHLDVVRLVVLLCAVGSVVGRIGGCGRVVEVADLLRAQLIDVAWVLPGCKWALLAV
eukprot:12937770-Prorocentrum_lima.AAC.1